MTHTSTHTPFPLIDSGHPGRIGRVKTRKNPLQIWFKKGLILQRPQSTKIWIPFYTFYYSLALTTISYQESNRVDICNWMYCMSRGKTNISKCCPVKSFEDFSANLKSLKVCWPMVPEQTPWRNLSLDFSKYQRTIRAASCIKGISNLLQVLRTV